MLANLLKVQICIFSVVKFPIVQTSVELCYWNATFFTLVMFHCWQMRWLTSEKIRPSYQEQRS